MNCPVCEAPNVLVEGRAQLTCHACKEQFLQEITMERVEHNCEESYEYIIDGVTVAHATYDQHGSEGMRALAKMFDGMAMVLNIKINERMADGE